VPFQENKRLKIGKTELIVSALPSGNGIGGTAWKIEYQKQTLIYALELNDKPTQITPPFPVDKFKNVNYLFTNAYLHDKQQHLRSNTNLQFVTEERLKVKVEAALLEKQSQILIPCSSKNKILALMLLFENMFKANQRLQQAAQTTKKVDAQPPSI
jgi:Cft2 family RNA processing exonuclease